MAEELSSLQTSRTIILEPNPLPTPVKPALVNQIETLVDPNRLVIYRPRPRRNWWRWIEALIHLITGLFLGWIFFSIPLDPSVGPFSNWKNPIVVFLVICFIGKTLLDTLFYDHYQP